jgi:gamma-glutamylcyclotransferase (GGCT)/AIG2-like uncharacterized protein YtfP
MSFFNLFVYGSLRRGQCNFVHLERCAPIEPVMSGGTENRWFTVNAFALIGHSNHSYPYMFEPLHALNRSAIPLSPVIGEIYRIRSSFLDQLDEFEGEEYSRRQITLRSVSEPNVVTEASAYMVTDATLQLELLDMLASGQLEMVTCGDWAEHISK